MACPDELIIVGHAIPIFIIDKASKKTYTIML